MKKRIFFLTTMILCCYGIQAQYSDLYYHRVGDTIEQNPNNGYFAWWEWDHSLESNELIFFFWFCGPPVYLCYHYTNTPLKVIGIAGIVNAIDVENNSFFTDTTTNQEYFQLYEASPSGHTLLAQAPWNLRDPHRYVHITANSIHYQVTDSCCQHRPEEAVFSLYESYFDSAVIVHDSFYVGGTYNSRSDLTNNDRYVTMYGQATSQLISGVTITDCKGTTGFFTCHFDSMLIRRMQIINNDTVWSWRHEVTYPLVYPIIQMDTTLPPADMCVGVEGVQTILSGDCLTVSWDYWPRYTSVQLRYGPINVAQSEWNTVEVTGATTTLCGLDTSVSHYGITLRAYCQSARDTTDWSPLQWVPMVQDPGDGIAMPQTALAASVVLSPNPAKGSVHVCSQHGLVRIEMVNARGIPVYSEPAVGHEAIIDLSGLPAGVYIVTVQTHNGTVAKRLVVE